MLNQSNMSKQPEYSSKFVRKIMEGPEKDKTGLHVAAIRMAPLCWYNSLESMDVWY